MRYTLYFKSGNGLTPLVSKNTLEEISELFFKNEAACRVFDNFKNEWVRGEFVLYAEITRPRRRVEAI